MFRRFNFSIFKHDFQTNKGFCTATEKWDLLTAVCLERVAKLVPAMNTLEKEFAKQLSTIEFEKSYKSDHEIRHEKDLREQKLLQQGKLDVDIKLQETTQDFADACMNDLKTFQKEHMKTLDYPKENKNLKSLSRKLDKHLVLLTELKIGKKSHYLLPQGKLADGETLRQCAERILNANVGNCLKAQIYGNAPAGFYKYRYPKIARENGTVGAKIFIYFARYNDGNISSKGINYKWLDRKELSNELPDKYCNSVEMFLMDES